MEESELLKRGEAIYAKLVLRILPHYKGQFIVIDPESAEYWIEKSLLSALKEARKKYKDKLFYSVCIGEEGVAKF